MRIVLAMASLASFLCLIVGGALAAVGIIIVTYGLVVGDSTPPDELIPFLGIGIRCSPRVSFLSGGSIIANAARLEVVQGEDRSGT